MLARAPQLRLLFAGPRDALQLLEGALGSASRTESQGGKKGGIEPEDVELSNKLFKVL